MKRLVFIIFFLPVCAISQGFDWQYSARMPVEYPRLFIGVKSGFSVFNHSAEFQFLQRITDINRPCCHFTDGAGNGYLIGLHGEYWDSGNLAFVASAGINTVNGNFSKLSGTERKFDTLVYTLVTDYRFESSITYITLEGGAKYRLFDSHFHVGGMLEISVLADHNIVVDESKVSPSWDPFEYKLYEDGKYPGIAAIVATPEIFAGYDFDIFGPGRYLSVFTSVNIPLTNTMADDKWHRWSFNFGLIFNGIAKF
jgi:hypothetical protein